MGVDMGNKKKGLNVLTLGDDVTVLQAQLGKYTTPVFILFFVEFHYC